VNIEPKDTNFYSSDPVKMEGDQMSDTPIMDAVDAKCDELGVMDAICYAVYEGQKLEIKLNNALEKINRLITSGDVMYTLLDPPSISMRTTEYDNALQGWDDAKTKY
jgi:hypothetical protein